ncbi:uncharacterized protein LOC101745636 isoform X2 [Bombyx mori]|uniref:uncharacterized protein LOC101745636 isoform X2 n=1 Tax=Bombyx mori TaxID=7091 RepID=UPI002ED6B3A2
MESKGRRKSLKKTGLETQDSKYSSATKAISDCGISKSSSHTIFMRKVKHGNEFEKISKESSIESSESYGCKHGIEGKKYSKTVTLEKSLAKHLDPFVLGYLLIILEEDDLFNTVSRGIIWHLSTPDVLRKQGSVHLRHTLAAAVPVLFNTVVRMLAVAKSSRFGTFLELALLLAYDTSDNCIEMMKDNIIENVFYRFNPYFPDRQLPVYDINPAEPVRDCTVKLGDSSIHLSKTLSLLLLLLKTTIRQMEEISNLKASLPCPNNYAQSCFIWSYRFVCRAKEHRHERITMTVLATALLHCFGDRMQTFSNHLMPDVMSMSVMSEIPPRKDWTATVNMNTSQIDVHFKKTLIYLSVAHLKIFSYHRFLVEDRHWLIGLMYLLDPGLCALRANWSAPLFAELRKAALQALVCSMSAIPTVLVAECTLIHRIMWYIEWYSESPYDLSTLYWCVRLLQVATHNRRKDKKAREISLRELFETHGIIILIRLCYSLLEQRQPPIEKSQVIISVCLRLLTSAVEVEGRVSCCVYPTIKWPSSTNTVAERLLDVVLHSLNKHLIVSDRLLISLLNFIWESIIWRQEYRRSFVAKDGIYKLLDIITMTRAPVQCIALAVICDVACAGEAVGQLVSWRANLGASKTYPNLVKRGATIASLLAAIFRDDCRRTGVVLDENGVIQEMDNPLMAQEVREELSGHVDWETESQNTPVCLPAGDLAGSRLSKTYALLQMLSEDLEEKVSLADEAYNLYQNVKLDPTDEATLVVCSHFLTLKLAEVWTETSLRIPKLIPYDNELLQEFLHIGKGWSKEIKTQQECVLESFRKKDREEERSLYEFLGRVRLNIALDALHEVRCVARSADRNALVHAMIHDAVRAHHRCCLNRKTLNSTILRTYKPMLDDQNQTGHNIRVVSINPKDKKLISNLSCTSGTVIYDPHE